MLSLSGGLVYHARAARHYRRWEPTRVHASALLQSWLKLAKPKTLVIVGPSAGYLMSPMAFAGLDIPRVLAIDPDRIAEPIFRHRLRNDFSQVDWSLRQDLLPFTSEQENTFANYVRELSPQTAVLFWGCLGQLPLHQSGFRRPIAVAQRLLLEALKSHAWASLHDTESIELSDPATAAEVAQLWEIWRSAPANDLQSRRSRIDITTAAFKQKIFGAPWIDHETDWISQQRFTSIQNTSQNIPWMLTPQKIHWLEFRAAVENSSLAIHLSV